MGYTDFHSVCLLLEIVILICHSFLCFSASAYMICTSNCKDEHLKKYYHSILFFVAFLIKKVFCNIFSHTCLLFQFNCWNSNPLVLKFKIAWNNRRKCFALGFRYFNSKLSVVLSKIGISLFFKSKWSLVLNSNYLSWNFCSNWSLKFSRNVSLVFLKQSGHFFGKLSFVLF